MFYLLNNNLIKYTGHKAGSVIRKAKAKNV
jgi:hypothetical protein